MNAVEVLGYMIVEGTTDAVKWKAFVERMVVRATAAWLLSMLECMHCCCIVSQLVCIALGV